MKKILLSGVPGAGKTTVSRFLEVNAGFFHLNMEQDDFAPRYEFDQNREEFIRKLAIHEKVVISWGFGPYMDRAAVDYIKAHGFSIVWLDGDRAASFREFMKRENYDPVKEANYYGQMQMIVVTDIVNHLDPLVVNPFSDSGDFRAIEDIAQEIIQATDNI